MVTWRTLEFFLSYSRHSFLPETLALVFRFSSFVTRRLYAQRNAYNFSVESGNNRIAAKQQKFERGGGRVAVCVCVIEVQTGLNYNKNIIHSINITRYKNLLFLPFAGATTTTACQRHQWVLGHIAPFPTIERNKTRTKLEKQTFRNRKVSSWRWISHTVAHTQYCDVWKRFRLFCVENVIYIFVFRLRKNNNKSNNRARIPEFV